jgi:hypothetical protein
MSAPLTPSERVARARSKAIAAGSRRLSNIMLPPVAAETLDRLIAAHYADSATVAICRALRDAAVARGIEPR